MSTLLIVIGCVIFAILRCSSWPQAGQPSSVVVGFFTRMAPILAVFHFTTLFFAIFPFSSVNAQDISTDIPVPPLQWLNLSGLLHGSSPPPLKDAAIGYDETRYVYPFRHISSSFRQTKSLYYHLRRRVCRWFCAVANISVSRYL